MSQSANEPSIYHYSANRVPSRSDVRTGGRFARGGLHGGVCKFEISFGSTRLISNGEALTRTSTDSSTKAWRCCITR